MLRMLVLALALVIFINFAAVADLRQMDVGAPIYRLEQPNRHHYIMWLDTMETGAPGWTHVDNTAVAVPHFHISSLNAYADGGSYSWYCGDETLTADGGYGNAWDDRLNLPVICVSGAGQPVWTFAYRYDSEVDYDFTYVQAESLGVWANLNKGFSGSSGGWQDLGVYGYQMAAYDDPIVARYRFLSDGRTSDADGGLNTDGGAFAVDNIKVFDFISGTIYFLDDAESGGLCAPSVPSAAGDWWHIIEDRCSSYNTPHCWWCGDDADTSLVPANLDNSLLTPPIEYQHSQCDCLQFRHFAHPEIPTVDNDFWREEVSMDGGVTWTETACWWGDFGACDGWIGTSYYGHRVDRYGEGPFVYRWTMHTTDNGCGPSASGGASLTVDDAWLEFHPKEPPDSVEGRSWGSIKAMYR